MFNNKKTYIVIAGVALVLVVLFLFQGHDTVQPESEIKIPVSTSTKASMKDYVNEKYGISFQYPSNLFFTEKETSTSSPEFSIALVENTKENRDVMNGQSTSAREYPITIYVDVYSNNNELNARDWIKKETNWSVGTQVLKDSKVAGEPAVIYVYDGLYLGKAYIVTKGKTAYVISVNWISDQDQLIKDFDMVLSTISLK